MIFVIFEGDVIFLGIINFFRFNYLREVVELREKRKVSIV